MTHADFLAMVSISETVDTLSQREVEEDEEAFMSQHEYAEAFFERMERESYAEYLTDDLPW